MLRLRPGGRPGRESSIAYGLRYVNFDIEAEVIDRNGHQLNEFVRRDLAVPTGPLEPSEEEASKR